MYSHKGIRGNELADIHAKSAKQSNTLDIPSILFTDLFESFTKQAVSETERIITAKSMHTGKIYFEKYYKSCKKPWVSKKKLKRNFIVTVNRSRTNHYRLVASLARVNIVNDENCRCNTEKKT